MVIHLSPNSITWLLRTQLVAASVTKKLLTALSNWFAKRLAILAFLICVKKHLPRPSVWLPVLTQRLPPAKMLIGLIGAKLIQFMDLTSLFLKAQKLSVFLLRRPQLNQPGLRPHLLGENDMKNYTTPRNFADCTWVQGYGSPEPLWERVAGYALAFVIGAGMAALLVAWWSS